MTELNDIQKKLTEQLLLSVKNKEPFLEYNEIAKRITPPIHWRHVGNNIGKISKLCHELGLPLLSAKVVHKNKKEPGEGFFPLYAELNIPTNGKSQTELYQQERKAIRECTEWYKLEDYLHLHVGMPHPKSTDPEADFSQNPPNIEYFKKEITEDSDLLLAVNDNIAQSDVPSSFDYNEVPKEKPAPIEVKGRNVFPRDRQISINALAHANYSCEINKDHPTFLRKNTFKKYTEPHHLIPMAYADDFCVSLDVEENIVSLCSNCHNQIHYGEGSNELIEKLFNERKNLLEKVGIHVTLEKLLSYYK